MDVWVNKHKKTYAFAGDGSRFQNGWTSDSRRFISTVPPETVLSKTRSMESFRFAPHAFDLPGQPGSYNASHVEAQAFTHVDAGTTPILVSRPMCDSCRNFVQQLAIEKGIKIQVGTPDGIHTISPQGDISESVSETGRTRDGIEWSMTHDAREHRSSLTLLNDPRPPGTRSTFSVERRGDRDEGPVATWEHRHSDGLIEHTIYYQNKGTVIQSQNVGGKSAQTRVGPSNGVQDSLNQGKWERVPKKWLG